MRGQAKTATDKKTPNDGGSDPTSWWEPLALVAAGAPTPAEALHRAIEIIGKDFHADRAWLGRFNHEVTHFWGVADWVGPGIVSHLQEIQGVPVEAIAAESYRKFLRGEIMAIPDVEKLPRQSRVLQAELRREGVRSTFGYPLTHAGKLIGFFGIDHVGALAAWSEAELAQLPTLAKFLAGLLQRSLTVAPPADLPASQDRSIYVSEGNGQRAVSLNELIYIAADGDYGRLYLNDGRNYFERRSLRSWVSQLPRERFLRVHQSYLVNGERIARLDRGTRWNLFLTDVPDPIPVGRAFRHALRLHMGF